MMRSPRQARVACVLFFGSAALALCSALVPQASAGDIPPSSDIVVSVTGYNPETEQGQTTQFRTQANKDKTFELKDESFEGTGWSLDELNLNGNIDPFASLNFAVTNNAGVPLLFTVSVTVPIVPIASSTVHGGSVGGALTDSNNNGVAMLATSGGLPYYQGQIDGTTVLPIYSDPYSLSVAFAGQTINLPALNPGLPGPTLPSGPALSTIGIINRFTLSPGDQFSGNSFFVVEPVPEPATLALLALALLAVPNRRR